MNQSLHLRSSSKGRRSLYHHSVMRALLDDLIILVLCPAILLTVICIAKNVTCVYCAVHDFYSHLTTIDELYCHNIVNNQRIVTWAHFLWVLTCYSWWLKVYGISLVNIWIDESNSAFFIAFIECWKEHYCVNFKLVFWTVEHVNESDSESDFRALVNLISLVKKGFQIWD